MLSVDDLDEVDTDTLVAQLKRRSRVMFIVLRPLPIHPDFGWFISGNVDGKEGGPVTSEDIERIIGLAYRGLASLLELEK